MRPGWRLGEWDRARRVDIPQVYRLAYVVACSVAAFIVVPTLLLSGEYGFLGMIFGLIAPLVLGGVLFPLAVPLTWLCRRVASRWFFFLRDNRLFTALGGLAFAVVISVAMASLIWLPGARFLKTDACLDAGGRMAPNRVCEYGPSGPN